MSCLTADASLGDRLERYTLKFPQEVLLVRALVDGEADTVIVFKGFSSSLMRPTAYDPEVPTIPEGAEIISIDRLEGPYVPNTPEYIERSVSLAALEARTADPNL